MICAIFSLQQEINEVTDSSGFCQRVFNPLRDTSTTLLKEYCLRNSCAKSVNVLRHEGSREANQRLAALLSDKGNNMIICVLSNRCPCITMLYNYKVDTGASNPRVSLNIWHAKLNRQSCHWQVIISIPT